jgi:hypothetical protein
LSKGVTTLGGHPVVKMSYYTMRNSPPSDSEVDFESNSVSNFVFKSQTVSQQLTFACVFCEVDFAVAKWAILRGTAENDTAKLQNSKVQQQRSMYKNA